MDKKSMFWSIAVFILSFTSKTLQAPPKCGNIQEGERFNCLPGESSPTQDACTTRQCCWTPTSNPNIPSCFYGQSHPGYRVISNTVRTTQRSIKATLERQGISGFPKDIQRLGMDVEYMDHNILRVKIYDKNATRYEPPIPTHDPIAYPANEALKNYEVSISNATGGFQVKRKDTREIIFDTSIGGFIFSDQFLQISSRLPSKYIYGLGEHAEKLLLNTTWKTYTLFNRGELPPSDQPQFNLYGTHAFYLSIEKSGKTHGVFLLNSNAMDIVLQPSPAITYRTIGGILDFYFFMGPTPDEVISQYTRIIRKPALPPYWSLGFHLSRYEYHTANKTREVWQRNVDAGIPFDTQWNDIDYMEDHKIFTADPVRFKELRPLIDDIHKAGMYWVPIVDPGLSGLEGPGNYPPYDQAKDLDILIKDYSGEVLTAKVWQNITVFVDFSNPKAAEYWERQYRDFYNKFPYDGSWIDMNEPYSFEMGSLKGCPANNSLDHPPYVPGNQTLFNGTICLSSKQFLSTHYDLHNLYSFMEGIATRRALEKIIKKRPFLLTRSQFAGYGHFGAHWTGDVHSKWDYMKNSIPNILNMNLFGVPHVGADICGFVGNTTEELCTRWTQLGAFYTFSRNHNDLDTIEQDPVAFGPDMVERVTKVMKTRYSLLPYLYSLFYLSHIRGTPILRPLFFDNLNDRTTYDIDTQFLWGKALMVLPVLDEDATSLEAYFPRGIWYDFYTGQKINSVGQTIPLNAPIDTINLAVKAGHIIPLQKPNRTTTESRKNPFQLIVALDAKSSANGELYWDDGDSMNPVETDKYNHISFLANTNGLTITPNKRNYTTPMPLSKITIYGFNSLPASITVNNRILTNFSYNADLKTLQIQLDVKNVSLLQRQTITWH